MYFDFLQQGFHRLAGLHPKTPYTLRLCHLANPLTGASSSITECLHTPVVSQTNCDAYYIIMNV